MPAFKPLYVLTNLPILRRLIGSVLSLRRKLEAGALLVEGVGQALLDSYQLLFILDAEIAQHPV